MLCERYTPTSSLSYYVIQSHLARSFYIYYLILDEIKPQLKWEDVIEGGDIQFP